MRFPARIPLENGEVLLVREAEAGDAPAMLEYLEAISGESEFLTFGPGEFEVTEEQERDFLEQYRRAENQIYLVGFMNDKLVTISHFAAGQRPRMRHAGELGMSVRKEYQGRGIGGRMLDILIMWARLTGIVTKMNLRVRTDNEAAIRLYESRGFHREGTLSRELRIDGKYHDFHWMGLEL